MRQAIRWPRRMHAVCSRQKIYERRCPTDCNSLILSCGLPLPPQRRGRSSRRHKSLHSRLKKSVFRHLICLLNTATLAGAFGHLRGILQLWEFSFESHFPLLRVRFNIFLVSNFLTSNFSFPTSHFSFPTSYFPLLIPCFPLHVVSEKMISWIIQWCYIMILFERY